MLQLRQEFLNALNLAAIDVISVKVWLDRKVRSCSPFLFFVSRYYSAYEPSAHSKCNQVKIPKASNACSGFDDSIGWTFFELNSIYEEYEDEPATVLEAELVSSNYLWN